MSYNIIFDTKVLFKCRLSACLLILSLWVYRDLLIATSIFFWLPDHILIPVKKLMLPPTTCKWLALEVPAHQKQPGDTDPWCCFHGEEHIGQPSEAEGDETSTSLPALMRGSRWAPSAYTYYTVPILSLRLYTYTCHLIEPNSTHALLWIIVLLIAHKMLI